MPRSQPIEPCSPDDHPDADGSATNIERGLDAFFDAIRVYQKQYWEGRNAHAIRPRMRDILPDHGCVPVEHRLKFDSLQIDDFLEKRLGPRRKNWTRNGIIIWVNDAQAANFVSFYLG